MNRALTISIDENILKQFKIYLIETDKRQISPVVEDLIRRYLEEQNVKSN